MTVILGIDPGSRVTGYGVIETSETPVGNSIGNSIGKSIGNALGGQQKYIGSGCIRTTDKAPLAIKLEEIYSGLNEIILEFQPDEFAIEKIFMARSAESALKLGHARGVAMLAGVIHGLPISEYEARKVKQAVVGTGAASKAQVQHMVQTLLKIPGKPQSDAADALAIAICHINTQFNLSKISGATSFRRGRLVKDS